MSSVQQKTDKKNIDNNLFMSQEKKPRVNINDLLLKVKVEEKKERKENVIFVGLVCSVIAVTGVIASL